MKSHPFRERVLAARHNPGGRTRATEGAPQKGRVCSGVAGGCLGRLGRRPDQAGGKERERDGDEMVWFGLIIGNVIECTAPARLGCQRHNSNHHASLFLVLTKVKEENVQTYHSERRAGDPCGRPVPQSWQSKPLQLFDLRPFQSAVLEREARRLMCARVGCRMGW